MHGPSERSIGEEQVTEQPIHDEDQLPVASTEVLEEQLQGSHGPENRDTIEAVQTLCVSKREHICPECFKRIGNKNLARHIKDNHNTAKHKCNTCNKNFMRKATLTNHARIGCPKDPAIFPIPCEKNCQKLFKTTEAMKTHFKNGKCSKCYQCQDCQEYFSTQKTFKSHKLECKEADSQQHEDELGHQEAGGEGSQESEERATMKENNTRKKREKKVEQEKKGNSETGQNSDEPITPEIVKERLKKQGVFLTLDWISSCVEWLAREKPNLRGDRLIKAVISQWLGADIMKKGVMEKPGLPKDILTIKSKQLRGTFVLMVVTPSNLSKSLDSVSVLTDGFSTVKALETRQLPQPLCSKSKIRLFGP